MRIASFNVENLFSRAKALALPTWEEGRPILEQHAEVNRILNHERYSDADKRRIVELLEALGLSRKDDGGRFALLRQNRGRLVKRPKAGGIEVVAGGRDDWVGWVELKTEPVNELATRHTAMVIRDLRADVLGVVEAENRISLRDFSSVLLRKVGADPYDHVMLIDGNDGRGIDVGIMSRSEYEIVQIVSHVDDRKGRSEIFSRDCPEYTVTTPGGEQVTVMVNHFKSKGFGGARESNAKRRQQAARVAELYRARREAGQQNVVVLGDLNDTPASAPLEPLMDTDLRDISESGNYVDDGRPGTFAGGTKSTKIDYILLSPALFERVTEAHTFRRGVWGGVHGDFWEIYPTMKAPVHAASDHAALVAEIDL